MLGAGLGKAKKGIAAIAACVAAGSRTDLTAGHLSADVILRHARAMQAHEPCPAGTGKTYGLSTFNQYERHDIVYLGENALRACPPLRRSANAIGLTASCLIAEISHPQIGI